MHGDFNVANVLVDAGRTTAVLGWEFAGSGWKECDITWALRALTYFLNITAERRALLDGYASAGTFDRRALRWCEVLNYLQFGSWNRASDPTYRKLALARAAERMGRTDLD